MNRLKEQIDQVSQIVDELNNLDFSNKDEDPQFLENISRLEQIHLELNGDICIKQKTNRYLQ